MNRPELEPTIMDLKLEYVNQLLGNEFTVENVIEYLEKMRYDAKADGELIKVKIPAYRADILHPIDLVEDIAIGFGYMNFIPKIPNISTIGRLDKSEIECEKMRDIMIGYNFMEIITLILTNRKDLFKRMNINSKDVTETINPVSNEHSVARNWLLPSLMVVLEKNRNREYPQLLFEIGDCVDSSGVQSKRIAAVMAHSNASFSEVKSVFTGFLEEIGLDYDITDIEHQSFIKGRRAQCEHGFFGELDPLVLTEFGLETPVAAFEINLKGILS